MKKILILVTVVLFLLIGCKEKIDIDASDEQVVVDDDIAVTDDNESNVSGIGDGGAGEDGADILKDIFDKKSTGQWTATYTVIQSGPDAITYTMKQSMDLSKYAITTTISGSQSKMIFDGSQAAICSIDDGKWFCLKGGAGQASDAYSNTFAIENSLEQSLGTSVVTAAGTCDHAGESGKRFKIGTDMTACYTSDGIMLELKSIVEGGAIDIAATSVARTVDESDFILPAEPVDLASLVPTS